MQKSYHFISGLPRSGSTLLTAILNQNPNFYSSISSPLARFIRSIIIESHAGPGYHLQCPESKRIHLIRSLIEQYHYDIDKPVCFNTNRGYTSLVDLLAQSNPDSKIICCVRDINWILDSFEVLFRKNPALMTPGHTLAFAYDNLKEAITGFNKNKLFLVEYEQLCKNPEQTIKALYKFINQPYFEHDFDAVEASFDEYDFDANIVGLHKVRKGVKFIERPTILPPDIWHKYSNLEVWR
jgi:sulfotransferase